MVPREQFAPAIAASRVEWETHPCFLDCAATGGKEHIDPQQWAGPLKPFFACWDDKEKAFRRARASARRASFGAQNVATSAPRIVRRAFRAFVLEGSRSSLPVFSEVCSARARAGKAGTVTVA